MPPDPAAQVPYFGMLRNDSSIALSPLGFGACTGGPPSAVNPETTAHWFTRSLEWEAALGPPLSPYQPEPPAGYVPKPVHPQPLTAQPGSCPNDAADARADGDAEVPPPRAGAPVMDALCELWCERPCHELNGDVRVECGSCSKEWRCNPVASAFPVSDERNT